MAFIAEDADRVEDKDVQAGRVLRTRAKRMFLRARGYGLDAMELAVPGSRAALMGADRDKRAAVHRAREEVGRADALLARRRRGARPSPTPRTTCSSSAICRSWRRS